MISTFDNKSKIAKAFNILLKLHFMIKLIKKYDENVTFIQL